MNAENEVEAPAKRATRARPSDAELWIEREIRSLILDVARLSDEQRYRDWSDLFVDNAVYAAITYENLNDKGLYLFCDEGIHSIRERSAYLEGVWQVPRGKTLHTVSNIEVTDISHDTAKARSYFVIYRTGDMEHSKLHACGEYRDSFVRQDDHWLFGERLVIVDTNLLPPEFTELL